MPTNSLPLRPTARLQGNLNVVGRAVDMRSLATEVLSKEIVEQLKTAYADLTPEFRVQDWTGLADLVDEFVDKLDSRTRAVTWADFFRFDAEIHCDLSMSWRTEDLLSVER